VAGQFAVITVTDNGHGIPDDRHDRVFDPFFSTKAGGTGLGLATVLGGAQLHGGHVHLSSTTGQGTTVRILLPMA
jgi:signal transduction histidine kinase